MLGQRELDPARDAVERRDQEEDDQQEGHVGHGCRRDLDRDRTPRDLHGCPSPRDSSVTFSAPASRSCSSTSSMTLYFTRRSALITKGCRRLAAVTPRTAAVSPSMPSTGAVSSSPAEKRKVPSSVIEMIAAP